MFITREGLAYLAVLSFVVAVALLRELNLLYMLAGLMIGPVLINAALAWLVSRKLSVRRVVPAALVAGDTLVANVSLSNPRSKLGAWMIVAHDTIEKIGGERTGNVALSSGEQVKSGPRDTATATAWFPYVPPGETRHASYRGQLIERGRYRFGPLRISCRFPLGLARRIFAVSGVDEVVVYPRIGRLTRAAETSWLHDVYGGSRARRRGRAEAEFHGLRDWKRGDSRRWIHWRSTARHGEVIVREFEYAEQHELAVILELRRDGARKKSAEIVERAVSIAATFVAFACRRYGARVSLSIIAADERAINGAATPALEHELLSELAIAEAAALGDRADERLMRVVANARRELRAGAAVVIVSTRDAAQCFTGTADGYLMLNAADQRYREFVDLS